MSSVGQPANWATCRATGEILAMLSQQLRVAEFVSGGESSAPGHKNEEEQTDEKTNAYDAEAVCELLAPLASCHRDSPAEQSGFGGRGG
jgi:hypothetical protein